MKMLRIFTIALVGLGALIVTGAAADQPATRPTAGSYSTPQLRGAMRALVGAPTAGVRPPTQQEWDDMMVFMRDHSPAQANVMDSIPLNHETSPIALEAIRKWRNYVFTSEHFPTIKDLLIARFRLEDDLFDLTLKYRADEGGNTFELQDEIHRKVAQIIQVNLKIRQARVERLETLLANEKSRLQTEQASQNEMVDQRVDRIVHRLDKKNPNLAPPTTRPDDGPSGFVAPPVIHVPESLMEVGTPADSSGK
jgi:hypothetical protein